mmetsp:Transcript_93042/g.145138  ORF Transcript_93042/g.145138 Transcript_93042/m.145138 type:complete len:1535 (-) Transcript_93042:24-4628(-)
MWSSVAEVPGGDAHGPSNGFHGAGQAGVPMPPQMQPPTMQSSPTGLFTPDSVKLTRNFDIQLHLLNDVPRAYDIRRPKGYIVRIFSGDKSTSKELARSKEIHGKEEWTGARNEEDFETVDCKGEIIKVEPRVTHAQVFVQVEFTDGAIIGSCKIHRKDPRSQEYWPYQLSDPEAGTAVNCGITLRTVEPQQIFFPQPAMPPNMAQMPSQAMPNPSFHPHPGPHHIGPLQEQQRPVAPPLFGPLPNLLELIKPGQAANFQGAPEKFGAALGHTANFQGALEMYGVAPAAHSPAVPVHIAPVPAPPASSAVTYNTYSYTLPPGQHDVRSPAAEQSHTVMQQNTYSYTLPPVHQNIPRPRQTLAIENGQAHQLLAIENGFDNYNHPGAYLVGQDHGSANDGLTEAWCAPPATSWQDSLFGSDQDLEVKAMYSEPWDRPLDAFDRPLFVEEDKFEDMDRNVIGREISLRHKVTHTDRQKVAERKKDGLPEFSFNTWVPMPKAKAMPKALPAPNAPPPPDPRAPPPRKVQDVRRAKGKINAELSLVSKEQEDRISQQLNDGGLSQLDPALFSPSFEMQAIGCLERDQHGTEKRAWLRTQADRKPQKPKSIDEKDSWLRRFWTPELTISVSCRPGFRGKSSQIPNQDNFSITQSRLDMALYVVCDGHGPLGHIAAFRLVQSLPKLTFDLLQSPNAPQPRERVLLASFAEANTDLEHFAKERKLDMSCSGATCSAVLRIGADVIISWVGDCGAFLATMTEETQTVDMATEPHTTDVPKELHRVAEFGAKIRPILGHNAKRIFRPGIEGPGTFATRSFGDFAVSHQFDCGGYGVTTNPDFKTTSFGQVPGLVVLASGGLLEVLPNAQNSLMLLKQSGMHMQSGRHHHGVSVLCDMAQKIWVKEDNGLIDDVTCMLLHWERPVVSGPPPPPPPQPTNLQANDPSMLSFRDKQKMFEGTATEGIPEEELLRDANVKGLFDPPDVTTDLRSKPTVAKWLDDLDEVARHCNIQALSQPDPTLGHRDVLAQVVSCIDVGEAFGAEKAVWFSEKGEPRAIRIDSTKKKEWLGKFQVANVQVVPISKRGQHTAQSHNPNQDNYSITAASGNRAIYVLCDGHGAFGHLVSFRVSQTLPIFVLEALAASRSADLQDVFSHAFQEVALDLEDFASKHQLDFTESGTSCAAVLRQGDKVFVSWLGDCRVLLATLNQNNSRVDFISSPHLPSSASEYRRLCEAGLPVQVSPGNPARIFSGTTDGPGLTISRALGDFCVRQGVICEPDGANSSFEGVPGLIFLASGGLCEHFNQSPGESMLQTLAVDGGLLEKGPDHALQHICSNAQQQWRNRHDAYCEDISGILIQWLGAGRTPATLSAVPQSSLQARPYSGSAQGSAIRNFSQNASYANQQQGISSVHGSTVQNLGFCPAYQGPFEHASQMRTSPLVVSGLDGRNTMQRDLSPDRIKQSGSSLPAQYQSSTTIASSTSQAPTFQREPRKFLQAQPQNSTPNWQSTSKARVPVATPPPAEEHKTLVPHANFLQAVPGRLTTVIE